jgi:hypothetical protein
MGCIEAGLLLKVETSPTSGALIMVIFSSFLQDEQL